VYLFVPRLALVGCSTLNQNRHQWRLKQCMAASNKYHTGFGEDEGTDRLEHVSQQACCDCGMNVGEFKARYVFLAETKKA
jgi:hypothetical protein